MCQLGYSGAVSHPLDVLGTVTALNRLRATRGHNGRRDPMTFWGFPDIEELAFDANKI